jgi:outer membrane murein-binding lipoprotein Lpp
MRSASYKVLTGLVFGNLLLAGCGAPAGNTSTAVTNLNSNVANANAAVTNANSNANTGVTIDTAREPQQYQGTIKLTLETIGNTQKATLPTLAAIVARSDADRVMEFTLPNNEKVIYLDKGGVNYVILPSRKQYAELTKEAVGFEVRRLLMPEQIVDQVKSIPGVGLVGEEMLNGRTVVKYTYSAAAQTQTQAGTVATDSYVLVDKETGLPVRTETISQSRSGGNVQGYSGLKIVTEMTDIKTTPDAGIFSLPPDFQRIDPEQVKAQVTLIFNTVGAVIGQLINQSQARPSPAAAPVR